jgi:hypothetical protein
MDLFAKGWANRPSTRCLALQKPKAKDKFLVCLCVCLPVALCPGDVLRKGSCPPVCVDALSSRSRGPRTNALFISVSVCLWPCVQEIFFSKRFLCPCWLKRKRQCCDFMPLRGKGASILEFAWSALCPGDFLQKGSCPPVCVDALSSRSRGPRTNSLSISLSAGVLGFVSRSFVGKVLGAK